MLLYNKQFNMHNFVQNNSFTSLENIQTSLHMIYAVNESPKENPEVISYISITKIHHLKEKIQKEFLIITKKEN